MTATISDVLEGRAGRSHPLLVRRCGVMATGMMLAGRDALEFRALVLWRLAHRRARAANCRSLEGA